MSSLTATPTAAEMFHATLSSEEALYAARLPFFGAKRSEASAEFQRIGFPTTKHEEWKYTNLAPVLKGHLRSAHPEEPQVLDLTIAKQLCKQDGIIVVIENGRLNRAASLLSNVPAGVTVDSFAALDADTRLEKYLGKYAPIKDEPLAALNTALVTDGIGIFVNANTSIAEKINLLVVTTSADALAVQPRILVVLETGASCTVTEQHLTYGDALPHFTNLVAETVCAPNARLTYVKLQDTDTAAAQVNFHQAHLERDAYLHITTLSLNGSLIRNDLHIRLNDQNCNAYLNGLYIINGKQLVDNHSLVDHAFPNCYSSELYKGIIDDHGQGVFNGKIFVRQDAQKTNAYQSNKNLLLSDHASMNAKPQLEIFADDVKCSHGATIGQIDEEALFYLRARGIGEASARALLNHAFAADVIEQIADEEVRQSMLARLDRKLEH
jgi:Fe-S cluster assembly protein SufD